jgi:hypothetical protein
MIEKSHETVPLRDNCAPASQGLLTGEDTASESVRVTASWLSESESLWERPQHEWLSKPFKTFEGSAKNRERREWQSENSVALNGLIQGISQLFPRINHFQSQFTIYPHFTSLKPRFQSHQSSRGNRSQSWMD